MCAQYLQHFPEPVSGGGIPGEKMINMSHHIVILTKSWKVSQQHYECLQCHRVCVVRSTISERVKNPWKEDHDNCHEG